MVALGGATMLVSTVMMAGVRVVVERNRVREAA